MAVARRPDERPAVSKEVAELRRRHIKARNWALLAALAAFAVLVYIVAIVRMSGG